MQQASLERDHSAEWEAAVKVHLERLLVDAHFSHSKRFPSFLRFIVEEELVGRGAFRCGLRMFFLASARSCCRWPVRRFPVERPFLPADGGSIHTDSVAIAGALAGGGAASRRRCREARAGGRR